MRLLFVLFLRNPNHPGIIVSCDPVVRWANALPEFHSLSEKPVMRISEANSRWCCRNLAGLVTAGVMLLITGAVPAAERWNPEIAGAVRLNNGLILYGVCELANTVDPELQDRRLEVRRINQEFRSYFVSTRRSSPPQPDELAVPRHDFRIIQHRTSQRPLNFEIGLHRQTSFTDQGTAKVILALGQGETAEIDVGVTAVNAQRIALGGLSHRWEFGVSMVAVPDNILYAGRNAPGLLKLARQFQSGDTQLNMVQMLLQAEKFAAAQLLLADLAEEFPELRPRCDRLSEAWNDGVGRRVLEELSVLQDTGKYETARRYARAWPDEKLAPVIRVRAKQFLEGLDEDRQRLATATEALNALVADVKDDNLRRQAMQVWVELQREMDLSTLPALTAFELMQLDPQLLPESRLALAASGAMLGAESAIDNFPETYGLLQIRFLLQDYLRTTDAETAARNALLEQIRTQEGFSIERVASLLQTLPPVLPLSIAEAAEAGPGVFSLPETADMAGCAGVVPAEYATTRRYPLIIALPREGLTSQETLEWWQKTADRNGYIVAVPELYSATSANYDATTDQHQKFLKLLVHLKGSLKIDDDRVFIAGHGIGGEAAMDLATAHPDLFAGVVSIASLGRKHLRWTAHNSLNLPWYVVAGSRQPRFYPRLGPLLEKLFSRVSGGGQAGFVDMLLVRYDERGFESYSEEIPNLFRWLNLQKRSPDPEVIEATTLRTSDRSWYWLKLAEIPDRFIGLDQASGWDDQPTASGTVAARINGRGNLIHLRTLPGDATLRLGPSTPGLDLTQKINLRTVSGRSQTIEFVPSLRDLLDDFRERHDRSRLCYMKVPVER